MLFSKFFKKFLLIIRIENLDNKNENIGRKYSKEPIFKGKGQPFKIRKKFIELKDREVKIQKEIEELCFNPTSVSIDDMDQSEKKRNEENKTN